MLLTDLAVDDELEAALPLTSLPSSSKMFLPPPRKREGIVQPVGQGVALLAEKQWVDSQKDTTNEGKIDEPGASVRNGVEKDETTFKKDKTTTQLKHLEPRAHEKNCVCGTC